MKSCKYCYDSRDHTSSMHELIELFRKTHPLSDLITGLTINAHTDPAIAKTLFASTKKNEMKISAR